MSTAATTPTPASGPDGQAADPRRWVALAVVLTAGTCPTGKARLKGAAVLLSVVDRGSDALAG